MPWQEVVPLRCAGQAVVQAAAEDPNGLAGVGVSLRGSVTGSTRPFRTFLPPITQSASADLSDMNQAAIRVIDEVRLALSTLAGAAMDSQRVQLKCPLRPFADIRIYAKVFQGCRSRWRGFNQQNVGWKSQAQTFTS